MHKKTSGGRATLCGSIAIPFRAAPAVSDICVSNDGPIRHYFPSRGRQAWTARARVTGISPPEDLSELPPLLAAVAGQEYHYWIAGEGRAGLL